MLISVVTVVKEVSVVKWQMSTEERKTALTLRWRGSHIKVKSQTTKTSKEAGCVIDEGRPGYVLSHHHLDLVLDLGPDVGGDVVGQLIGGALEVVHHLLELADHGVPRLLLPLPPVLDVGLQLLDVCGCKSVGRGRVVL